MYTPVPGGGGSPPQSAMPGPCWWQHWTSLDWTRIQAAFECPWAERWRRNVPEKKKVKEWNPAAVKKIVNNLQIEQQSPIPGIFDQSECLSTNIVLVNNSLYIHSLVLGQEFPSTCFSAEVNMQIPSVNWLTCQSYIWWNMQQWINQRTLRMYM